jgi:uncharacterized protein YukE
MGSGASKDHRDGPEGLDVRLAEQDRVLQVAFRELQSQWDAVQRQWNDAAGQQFERGYWRPLEKSIVDYLAALEEVAATLGEAEAQTR